MAKRRITQHAIQRFIERVDRSATPADASRRIAEMATSGNGRGAHSGPMVSLPVLGEYHVDRQQRQRAVQHRRAD